MNQKRQNRNKNAECDACGRSIRSDTVKRYKQIHNDLVSLPDNHVREELKARQEKKKQEVNI